MSNASHIHTDDIVVDMDEHFTIDTITRSISSRSNKKLSLMQYDHNSERYSFDVDRIIDGHDLMDCDRVTIHYINISSNKKNKHPGVYSVEDVQVKSSDDTKITFTWLVSGNATHYDGVLSFLISFECTEGDKVLYRWSSSAFQAIQITTGMDNDNTILDLYADELLAWQNKVETEIIPKLVDERYVEKVFATSEEVSEVFEMSPSDLIDVPVASDKDIEGLFDETNQENINQNGTEITIIKTNVTIDLSGSELTIGG